MTSRRRPPPAHLLPVELPEEATYEPLPAKVVTYTEYVEVPPSPS